MRDSKLSKTLLAKAVWEKVLAQAGHIVKYYHAVNGRFSDNRFLSAVNSKDYKIKLCGVSHHHPHGLVEPKNKILTQGARTLLLHGMCMWQQIIYLVFWPFVFK